MTSLLNTDLELLDFDVEEEVLVNVGHVVLLAVFVQVLVEVEHLQGHGARGTRLQAAVELLAVVLVGLGPTSLEDTGTGYSLLIGPRGQ